MDAENRALVQLKERLQASVQEEKRRSQSLTDEVQELQLQLEKVGAQLGTKTRELSDLQNELSATKQGANQASAEDSEVMALQQELRAVSHHRDTLSNTTARLEEKSNSYPLLLLSLPLQSEGNESSFPLKESAKKHVYVLVLTLLRVY